MSQKLSPILPAVNISATEMFYKSKLNFQTVRLATGLRVFNDDFQIHFYHTTDKTLCEQTSFYIFVTDIEDVYAQLSAKDIILPEGQLKDGANGQREFQVLDNNGIRICFAEI